MPKRYIIALVIFAVIFFGGIFLLINIITGGSNGNPDKPSEQTVAVQRKNSLSKDAEMVNFTTYGRVVGEEARRAIRISISTSERKVEVLSGFDESVMKSSVTPNKQSAYEGFLLALEPTNFTTIDPEIKTDERTVCPTGNRFVYETKFKDNSSVRGWSATCSKTGNFKGNVSLTRTLFEAQIPDYSTFVSDVRL